MYPRYGVEVVSVSMHEVDDDFSLSNSFQFAQGESLECLGLVIISGILWGKKGFSQFLKYVLAAEEIPIASVLTVEMTRRSS
jgi:hypothetical protein